MCATLLILEATLLRKPFEEFTVEDIQKINAFLVHGIDIAEESDKSWYTPGAFRKGRSWVQRAGNPLASLPFKERLALRDIGAKIDLHHVDSMELDEFLTEKEYMLQKKAFLETCPGPKIARALKELLTQLISDYKTNELTLSQISACMHIKLTLIHPFLDGNGRTARLLMNCLLMKEGKFPFITLDSPAYNRAIARGDSDPFCMYDYALKRSKTAESYATTNEQPYLLEGNLNSVDLCAVIFDANYYLRTFNSIKNDLEKHCYSQVCTSLPIKNLSKEEYQLFIDKVAAQYNDLVPSSSDFEQKVGNLKRFCLKALSMSDRFCSRCDQLESTNEFKSCSRCKKNIYCSVECQKQDWPTHKTYCKAS
ncbi:Fic family protein [Candidatus Dependentiae bacterium]|nr:Fic family protein [Candidatus Dependentiae bacterium]